MGEFITPGAAGRAALTLLALAEMYQRWDLFRAIVRYIEASDGHLLYLGEGEYVLEYPKQES